VDTCRLLLYMKFFESNSGCSRRPAVFKATPKSAGGKAAKKAKAPSAFRDLWMQVGNLLTLELDSHNPLSEYTEQGYMSLASA
jgi:hypothetical protein